MRPVKKFNVGYQLPIEANLPTVFQNRGIGGSIIKKSYNPYSDSKDFLEFNLGSYCSYCEQLKTDEAAQVEHIKCKNNYPNLEFSWINFLISCQRCNLTKGTKNFNLSKIYFPTHNNTFLVLNYMQGGFVKVSSKFPVNSIYYKKAESLLELTGLNLRPGSPNHKPKDRRWQRRKEAWEIIKETRDDYSNLRIELRSVVKLAKAEGFWSIWYTLFKDCFEVRKALVQEFPGTDLSSFDPITFLPIPRNPSNTSDPI